MKMRVISCSILAIIAIEASTLKYFTSVEDWPRSILLFYYLIQDFLTCTGWLLLIFPLLLSKFKPLSYILTMKGFSFLGQIMLPLILLLPMMFLRYYFELHQMITLNYYHMIFYSIGTYIFTLPFSYVAFMFLKAPIESLLKIYQEGQMVLTG
jgi:hypothetical protein